MNYWLTTHWPQRYGDNIKYENGIWLKEGDQNYGKDIKIGDTVLIYESKTGRTIRQKNLNGTTTLVKCNKGREGIIQIGEITTELYIDETKKEETYTDGSVRWWRWHARAKIKSQSGFVPRKRVNEVLGYSSTYPMKGYGTGHTGLDKISKEVYEILLTAYNSSLKGLRVDLVENKKREFKENESPAHKKLKEYVASNPSNILKEDGLTLVMVEYPFPTMDRADIVLKDKYGNLIGVEIELIVGDDDYEGPLQAIKYRRMLEWLFDRAQGDSRSILVANKISNKIKEKCKVYDIECFEINM